MDREATSVMAAPADVTDDAVLGGRLKLLQPRRGHRVGHDAILLAAAVAAQAGDVAVDLGAGVGAAGLALAVRVAGLRVALIDIDPALAALAGENAARNGLGSRIAVHALDIAGGEAAFAAAGLGAGSATRVLMNPPFNLADRGGVTPDLARRRAHVADGGTIAAWISAAVRLLAGGGVLTLIHRADALADVLAAVAGGGLGAISVMPVHPREGMPAIRVLISAIKGSGAPLLLLPPLMLQSADGRPSAAAEAVLRDGAALPLAVP